MSVCLAIALFPRFLRSFKIKRSNKCIYTELHFCLIFFVLKKPRTFVFRWGNLKCSLLSFCLFFCFFSFLLFSIWEIKNSTNSWNYFVFQCNWKHGNRSILKWWNLLKCYFFHFKNIYFLINPKSSIFLLLYVSLW